MNNLKKYRHQFFKNNKLPQIMVSKASSLLE